MEYVELEAVTSGTGETFRADAQHEGGEHGDRDAAQDRADEGADQRLHGP